MGTRQSDDDPQPASTNLGKEVRRLRRAARLTQQALADHVHYSRSYIALIETGRAHPSAEAMQRIAAALHDGSRLLVLHQFHSREVDASTRLHAGDGRPLSDAALHSELEHLRRDFVDSLSGIGSASTSLEGWHQIVLQHGSATRHRPAALLLPDLVADFTELQRVLQGSRAVSTLRGLTRLSAQLAGLMSLTLIRLGDRSASRQWGRAASFAADEAGDSSVASWVRAQEAYALFYSGDLLSAVTMARHAEASATNRPGVGTALASALAARAYATLGRRDLTYAAVERAELALSSLSGTSLAPSAFGYNEAQLRFHQGDALIRLHEWRSAADALNHALDIYPESDYMDRALIKLNLAACLLATHDSAGALTQAESTVLDLDRDQRDGLIMSRVRELVLTVPPTERRSRAALGLQDLLMLSTESEGTN